MILPGSVLSWYLMRNLLKWIGIVGLAITTLVVLFDLAELVRKAASKTEVGFSILLQMLFLKAPSLIQQVLPFIILFSSLLTLWTLNRHQEMTVIKASGVSVWQMISPLVGIVLFLGALDLAVVNPLSSEMMLRYEQMDQHYFKKNFQSLAISESGLWVREKKGDLYQVFQIAHVDSRMHVCQKISVLQFDMQDHFLKRIEAQSGVFKDHLLILKDVWQQQPGEMPRSMKTLALPTEISVSLLQNAGTNPETISFWKLRTASELLENSGLSSHKYQMYWHSLLARWIWMGIMVILAAGCSLRFIRQRGAGAIIGIGALCAFLLYVLRDVTYALGNAGTLPVILSAWAPAVVSLLLGLTVLLYFEEG